MIKKILSTILLISMSLLIGIGLAFLMNWAKNAPIYRGEHAILAIGATLLVGGTAVVFSVQKYILWNERRKLKKLLSGAIRKQSTEQPSD